MENRLTRKDWLLLAAFCSVLFGFVLIDRRTLTTHETIHCQNVREMGNDGDWIIPHYGGRPWLERPPLPHLMTGSVVWLSGCEKEWAYRLGSVFAALAIVALTASLAALWYGRWIGLLTGLILATAYEFNHYATGPECDIFLCLIITAAMTAFGRCEFAMREQPDEDVRFLGKRSGMMLAFFVLLGMSNMAKGLFFGTTFMLVPVAAYLLSNLNWRSIRRYLWFWGWIAFAVAAAAWPVAAWLRQHDIIELWQADYMGRINGGYMREPAWYYFANLPLILCPWLLAGIVGLVSTADRYAPKPATPERLLWCWAIVPVLFFTLPQGKHHHYLLHCVPAWAILSAFGLERMWRWATAAPNWLRNPLMGVLLLALPAEVALMRFGERIPGGQSVHLAILVLVPLAVGFLWWAGTRREVRLAAPAFFAGLLGCYLLLHGYKTHITIGYRGDRAFIEAVRQRANEESDRPLLVIADYHPLSASWLLFYLGNSPTLLHNATFLGCDDITAPEVLVVTRALSEPTLREYGTATVLLQSEHTQGETSPQERWTLFRLRFRQDLVRVPGHVYISPAQAAARTEGPVVALQRKHN